MSPEEIHKELYSVIAHLPKAEKILQGYKVDVSIYYKHELIFIIQDCIQHILSHMKNNKTNLIVEEKLNDFLNLYDKLDDGLQFFIANLFIEEYKFTSDTFKSEKWKKIYKQYRS